MEGRKVRISKEIIIVSSILFFTLLLTIPIPANAAEPQVSIYFDGKEIYADETEEFKEVLYADMGRPFIDDAGRTQVPVRLVCEFLEAEVDWDPENRIVNVSKNDVKVKIPIGQPYIEINDAKQEIDTEAQIISNRTYLPIRPVLEAFDYRVDWNATLYRVRIDSPIMDENLPSAAIKWWKPLIISSPPSLLDGALCLGINIGSQYGYGGIIEKEFMPINKIEALQSGEFNFWNTTEDDLYFESQSYLYEAYRLLDDEEVLIERIKIPFFEGLLPARYHVLASFDLDFWKEEPIAVGDQFRIQLLMPDTYECTVYGTNKKRNYPLDYLNTRGYESQIIEITEADNQ